MRGALELRPELGGASFAEPAGITSVEIDSDTGMLAAPSCTHRELVALTPALAPRVECLTHSLPAQLAMLDTRNDQDAAVLAQLDQRSTVTTTTRAPHGEATRFQPAATELQPATSAQARTQVDLSRDGRARLSNDLQLVRDQERHR